MAIDPKTLDLLAKAGIEGIKSSAGIAKMVTETLEKKYRFSKPRKFPRLGFSLFKISETRTIGARQFVLEEGLVNRKFWRIREKAHPFSTYYFVWDTFESHQEARELWEHFCALIELRDEVVDQSEGNSPTN